MMLDIRHEIGDSGEKIVESLLSGNRTDYWFDDKKDGMIGELVYEVKTFRLNKSTNGFWLGQNKSKTMWKKVDNADLLFFIRIPIGPNSSLKEDPLDVCKLYLAIDHRNSWTKAYRNDGTLIRNYPLTKCLPLYTIDKNIAILLRDSSEQISRW